MAYMRLGDLLIAAGAITQEQLEEALTIQKQKKERLGDVLIENNIITERQLIEALQMQLGHYHQFPGSLLGVCNNEQRKKTGRSRGSGPNPGTKEESPCEND